MERVGALVVNYNGEAVLPRCLGALLAEGLAPRGIVVVDNGSTDGSHRRAAEQVPGIVLAETPGQVSFAAANNLGIRRLAETGPPDLVLFVNNDAFLSPGCLARLAAALADDPALGAATPRLVSPGGEIWYGGGEVAWREGGAVFPGRGEAAGPRARRGGRVTAATLCVLLVRWTALERTGLLDESYFFYDEDVEFCLRLTEAGFGLGYVPEAEAVHVGGYSTSSRGEAFVYRNMARNRIVTMRRHGTLPRWLLFLPWFAAMMAWKSLRFTLAGRPGTAAAIAGGLREGLTAPLLPVPTLGGT
jgi:hypothetical protein